MPDLKNVILCLSVLLLVGCASGRDTTPSNADHRLLTLATDGEPTATVALNLRLLKTANADPTWKDAVESAEQHLLKLGNIPPRHRALVLDTFSSFAAGLMETSGGTVPFRVFASHGPEDAALEVLQTARLIEATKEGDYVLIDPETCQRQGPLRLLKTKQLLAFVPPALAADVSARLAREPSQKMDPLFIAQAGVEVGPVLEPFVPGLLMLAIQQFQATDAARRISFAARADASGAIRADVEFAGPHPERIQALWERVTTSESALRTVVASSTKLQAGKDVLRITFDVNALRAQSAMLRRAFSPFSDEPLPSENLEDLREGAVLSPENVVSYPETLTPESFLALSGDDCSPWKGDALDETKKLRLAFTSLRASFITPEADHLQLTARVCQPRDYVPVLARRKLMELRVQQPELHRPLCGPLAASPDGMKVGEDFSGENASRGQVASHHVQFALKPGVDAQTLPAITGSVTVHVPARIRSIRLPFAAPFARAEQTFPDGKLFVEGLRIHLGTLTFQLGSEGTPPTVLAVRALNAEGKYLRTEARPGLTMVLSLPLFGVLSPDAPLFTVEGRPAQIELVLVDATTPYTRPFTLTPPFPSGNAAARDAEALPLAMIDQTLFEQHLMSPESVARRTASFSGAVKKDALPAALPPNAPASPFHAWLVTDGVFRGDVEFSWPDDVQKSFAQADPPVTLELLEADFADGTRLRAADIEAVDEEDQYVWHNGYGQQLKWSTTFSPGRSWSFTHRGYIPHQLERVPLTRLKGQLSFALPEKWVASSPTALSLHTEARLEGGRFKVEIIEPGRIRIQSHDTGQEGFSAVFDDAKNRPVDSVLTKRTDFDDATFMLDFETRQPAHRWRMIQSRGTPKTYAYPFEILAQVPVAPTEPKPVPARKAGPTRKASPTRKK
ncbi:hypothetical protein HRD49_09995 [Corallococcus exiguus]|uniref:hypothetical protein n=1 Tax=Corallococcus exiguus TaxID=83462 RepID=UPI0015606EC7|nr:hypothetical protein [Corallococcus exiguus]NRD62086.1 hypothetical protein [Corallococcus exiguus]